MFTTKMLISVILLGTSLILYNAPSVSATSATSATSVPLFLTPYIQQGKITKAKKLSLVNDTDGIIPRSYAGYITVDQNMGNHLFFWFFPSLNSNSSAPLLIWLNGGPGESSMVGLLLENGPIQLGKNNSGHDIYIRRNNSWVDKFSMLYIDNPVAAGYSYSENLYNGGGRATQTAIAGDLYEFIKQFYQIFSEFRQNDLYIGGQSYAGKYVPSFALRVHDEITNGNSQLRLRGIYLGGPLLDPSIQLLELFDLYYNLGYIKKRELKEFKRNWTEQLPVLEGEDLYFHSDLMFQYSNGNFHTSENTHFDEIAAVMTSDKMRSLLHIGNNNYSVNNMGELGYLIFTTEFRVPSVSPLTELMNNYKVLIFGGDLDGLVSASGLEAVLMSMQWSSQLAYNDSIRLEWREKNGTSYFPKGFYTRVSNFCRVVIKASGHRTGIDQPSNTLEMMEKFVANGCLD